MGWGWRRRSGTRFTTRCQNSRAAEVWAADFGGRGLFLEDPYLGITFEDFLAVGGVRELPGEIVSGVVLAHVVAVRPQAAAADVVDLAPEGNIDRSAIGAGAGGEFRQGEFPHIGQSFCQVGYPCRAPGGRTSPSRGKVSMPPK